MSATKKTDWICDKCGREESVPTFEDAGGNTIHPLPDGWAKLKLLAHPRRENFDVCSSGCGQALVADFMDGHD